MCRQPKAYICTDDRLGTVGRSIMYMLQGMMPIIFLWREHWTCLRRGDERPLPPGNFAGDYAGGGTMLAMGDTTCNRSAKRVGKGQVIDVAMTDGANYVALPLFKWMQPGGIIPLSHLNANLSTLHQGPHWSNTYTCKCGGWISVQSMEPQFYKVLIETLQLDKKTLPHQYDPTSWPWMKKRFEGIFLTKSRDEWEKIFKGKDACVAPVLSALEAAKHPHNIARGSLPQLRSILACLSLRQHLSFPELRDIDREMKPKPGFDTLAVLNELGLSSAEVSNLMRDKNAVDTSTLEAKL